MPTANASAEISQAVGVGFVIMGVIGYIVKLGGYTMRPVTFLVLIGRSTHSR